MEETTKRAIGVLGVAGAFGVVSDLLLQNTYPGINVLICVMVLLTGVIVLKQHYAIPIRGDGYWLAIPAVLAAAGFAVRDSPTLVGLDVAALGASLLLAARFSRAGRTIELGVLDYVHAIIIAGVDTLYSSALLMGVDIRWQNLNRSEGRSRNGAAIGRGMLFSVPLVLVFGGLLTSADPLFAHYIQAAFQWNFNAFCERAFFIGLGIWIAGGYLRHLLLTEKTPQSRESTTQTFSLGSIEVCTILAALDVLFFAFVLVQIRYFFGGSSTILTTVGLTYASYARHGFFELVTVAGLVLPLLLVLHALLRRETPAKERPFQIFAGILLGLLFVIMASAVQRMNLYRNEYGLTELRIYTTAFMGWLAIVFIWFALTVLRGKRNYFATGALATAFVSIFALHTFNSDAQIVSTNAALARSGHQFDACYATSLSAAAVPALLTEMPLLTIADQQTVAYRLLHRWSSTTGYDWRSWCWDRANAWQNIKAQQAHLTELSKDVVSNPCTIRDAE